MTPILAAPRTSDKPRGPFGAVVALWWFGENFGHSSPYGFHDWEYLLGETGLLHLDHGLAQTSRLLGVLVMVPALTWGAWLLVRQLRYLNKQD